MFRARRRAPRAAVATTPRRVLCRHRLWSLAPRRAADLRGRNESAACRGSGATARAVFASLATNAGVRADAIGGRSGGSQPSARRQRAQSPQGVRRSRCPADPDHPAGCLCLRPTGAGQPGRSHQLRQLRRGACVEPADGVHGRRLAAGGALPRGAGAAPRILAAAAGQPALAWRRGRLALAQLGVS